MKNFTKELKNILKEDPGAPILSPDEVRGRANTMVILTNQAPPKLLALGGSSRKAILVNYKPLMITFPDQRGVYQVEPDDIVFENHHTGRDVTEAGSEETSYEKFFAGAMKKFGVSSPIELSPDETKKFFDYVDKNWEAEEESDGSKTEIVPALALAARAAPALAKMAKPAAKAAASMMGGGGDDKDKEKPAADKAEDVSTGKVGKKDKGSYQHAYKLALKKYKIHSADELDTPAERKGFTAYVDRLWKGGEVHEAGAVNEIPVGALLKVGKLAAKGIGRAVTSKTAKSAAKKVGKQAVKSAGEFARSKEGKRMKKKFTKAAEKRGVEMISGAGKKKKEPQQAPQQGVNSK